MPSTPEVCPALFCPLSHFSNIASRVLRILPPVPRHLSSAFCRPSGFCLLPTAARLLRCAFCLLLLLITCDSLLVAALAQGTTATLSGTVTDQNGAVIPDVSIAVINIAQGFQRSATTNGEGTFVIPLLPPGSYTVKAEHEGFTPTEVRDVVLNVNDKVAMRIHMSVGTLSQTVQIVEGSSLINESPAVGTTVDRHFLQNLPLNGRSFQSLISLTPGVVLTRSSGGNPGQFSVNGQRANANYFMVDGVSANIGVSTQDTIGQQAAGTTPGLTSFGGTNNLISVDALEEFKIQTSSVAPEFGRSPGAQISLVSRAGTNTLRGTIFEYFRNDALDANDYFSNRSGLRKAALRQNDFGGTLGGPIYLPRFGEGGRKWLSGKNHSYFFLSYEGLRLRQPQTVITTVPSARLRAQVPDYIRGLLNAFPAPQGAEIGITGQAPLSVTYSDPSTLNATSFRLDHAFNERWTTFGRFNYAPSQSALRSRVVPSETDTTRLGTLTTTVSLTGSLTPQLINDLRFNYSRSTGTRSGILDNFSGATPITLENLLLPATPGPNASVTIQTYLGNYIVGNFNDNIQRQLNIIDNLTSVRGNHSLKTGVDYRRLTPIFQARDYQLIYNFTNEAGLLASRATVATVTGFVRTLPIITNTSIYGQDSWRASRKLTLTYGLRWELNPPPSEATGKHPFALTSGDALTAKIAPEGTPLYKTTYNNFAPRFGLAYQLIQRPGRELVLRGGIGLFYDIGNSQANDVFTHVPFARQNATPFSNVTAPLTATQAQLPPLVTNPATMGFTYAVDPNLKLPYTWQWNVSAEQSLGTNHTISASYVAAIGRRLPKSRLLFLLNPAFRLLQFTGNGATSDYHALQIQFQRRLSKRFQALASYTWSHAIDEISDEVNTDLLLRGNADFDIRHNFSSAITYNLPSSARGFGAKLLGNWYADLIVHAQSSYPLTVVSQSVTNFSGQLIQVRPNLITGVPLYIADPLVAGGRRINKAAFQAPVAGTQGNLGRNTLRGFPLYQADVAVRRQINLTERYTLTIRAEAFNVFNHPNFAPPTNSLSSPLFGQSTLMLGRNLGGLSPIFQVGGPRSIQLAIRFGF